MAHSHSLPQFLSSLQAQPLGFSPFFSAFQVHQPSLFAHYNDIFVAGNGSHKVTLIFSKVSFLNTSHT